MIKKLPVAMPMFTAYHYAGSAGIIAANNPTSKSWYYSNTINWRCIQPTLEYYNLDLSFCNCSIWDMPFIEKSNTSFRFIRKYVIEIIEEMLIQDCYVIFSGVDDYYIQGKHGYMQRHYNHDGLIVGFDSERKKLSMVAYDERGLYREFETPYDGFIRGIEYECEHGKYGVLTSAQVDCNYICELDPQKIKSLLKEYISEHTEQGYFPGISITVVYGMLVYNAIVEYIKMFVHKELPIEALDQRIFRYIYEHKRCMYQRIVALEKHLNIDTLLKNEYNQIQKTAESIRFRTIKAELSKNPELLTNVICNIQQMFEIENKVLSQLISIL